MEKYYTWQGFGYHYFIPLINKRESLGWSHHLYMLGSLGIFNCPNRIMKWSIIRERFEAFFFSRGSIVCFRSYNMKRLEHNIFTMNISQSSIVFSTTNIDHINSITVFKNFKSGLRVWLPQCSQLSSQLKTLDYTWAGILISSCAYGIWLGRCRDSCSDLI